MYIHCISLLSEKGRKMQKCLSDIETGEAKFLFTPSQQPDAQKSGKTEKEIQQIHF